MDHAEVTSESIYRIFSCETLLLQLVLDPSFLTDQGLLPACDVLLDALESLSRRVIYSVHCRRTHLLDLACD